MAHFAKLDENNIVLDVVVVNNDVLLDESGQENEQKGIDFLTSITNYPLWKQTSYNGTVRKNYAGIGYTYDTVLDAFIPPKPADNAVLNQDTCTWTTPPGPSLV